jgi:hypothetical protein
VVVHLIRSGSGDGDADGHDMSPSAYHASLTRPLGHASVHPPLTSRPRITVLCYSHTFSSAEPLTHSIPVWVCNCNVILQGRKVKRGTRERRRVYLVM